MNTSPLIQESPGQKIQNALSLLGKEKKSIREMRELILGLEAAMQAMPGYIPGESFKTTHHFEPGIYMREALIPKGMIVTGKIHKTAHLNILSQGKLTVWTENGMKTLTASTVVKSLPGIKRVGYAHEDSIWITVHQNPSDERDLKKVEARLFAENFDEAYLASPRHFQDAIHFLGFSPEEVKALSEHPDDQISFPTDTDGIRIGESVIHGLGVFATKRFEKDSFIARARIQGKRTPMGRFCNHSGNPNGEMIMRESGDVDLIAMKDIEPGNEILNDYYLSFVNTRPELLLAGKGRVAECQLSLGE
jgi:hypothetical protein